MSIHQVSGNWSARLNGDEGVRYFLLQHKTWITLISDYTDFEPSTFKNNNWILQLHQQNGCSGPNMGHNNSVIRIQYWTAKFSGKLHTLKLMRTADFVNIIIPAPACTVMTTTCTTVFVVRFPSIRCGETLFSILNCKHFPTPVFCKLLRRKNICQWAFMTVLAVWSTPFLL